MWSGNRTQGNRKMFARVLTVGALLAAIAVPASVAQAQTAGSIVRVEEDWAIVLNEPNDGISSPQFHTVMSPTGDLNSLYAQVTWNYRESPDFAPGGLELQMRNGEVLAQNKIGREDQFSTWAETIRWTQTMETNGVNLNFSIKDGQSITWGPFGYGEGLHVSESGGPLNLNTYSPDVSVQNACITYGSNRVNALVLMEVRYYSQTGLVKTDGMRVVYVIGQ